MRTFLESHVEGVKTFLLILCTGVLLLTPSIQAGAQDIRVLCLDEPALSAFDTDGDNSLTVSELDDAVRMFPDNQYLRDLMDRVGKDEFTEVQYTGRCHAEGASSVSIVGESGESVVGEPGESVQGEDGESVVGEPGESVQGEDGASVSVTTRQESSSSTTIQQESSTEVRSESSGTVICAPSPQLALIDTNDDGVASIEEIDALIELISGNEELESLRDEVVEQGIIGIQYRDCVPGTPAATPISATPAATPGATPEDDATPSASVSDAIEVSASRSDRDVSTLLYAGAGGSALLAVVLMARGTRKSQA